MLALSLSLALLPSASLANAAEPVLLAPAQIAGDAVAQDDEGYDEGDDEGSDERKKSKSAGQVREIVRGFYAKGNVGAATYLLGFSPAVSTGSYVALAVGQDFVDNEKQSMAWEVAIQQGLHNGLDWASQADYAASEGGCGFSVPCTQGDLRTYTLAANYEISF